MKAFLLFSFLCFAILANAQSTVYHPFPITNAHWVYQYWNDNHQPTGWYGSYDITGDTVISGINYKKISGCDAFHGKCNSGGIRDSNRVIYFRPDTSLQEFILYDFNLQVGDSIIHPFGGAVCTNDTVVVWSIDSVLCSDGYHKQFYLSSFATWIEGIGSRTYLLSPCDILCVSGDDALECMITDSGFSYPSGIGSCIASVSTNLIMDNEISISPIPSSEWIEVNSTNSFSVLRIINSLGQQLYRQNSVSKKQIVNINFLSSGIYFLQFLSDSGASLKMFVKE